MLMHRREKESSPVNVAAFEGSSNELAPYYVDAVNRAMDDLQRGLNLVPSKVSACKPQSIPTCKPPPRMPFGTN